MRRSMSEVKSIGQDFIPVYVALGAIAVVVLYYVGTQDTGDNQNQLETSAFGKSEEPLKCPEGWFGRALVEGEWPYGVIRSLGNPYIIEPPPYLYIDKYKDTHEINVYDDFKKFKYFYPNEVICILEKYIESSHQESPAAVVMGQKYEVQAGKAIEIYVRSQEKLYRQTSRQVQAMERGKRWF